MPPHRLTRRQRVNRIRNRIIKAGKKGITLKQIARRERISTSSVYYYLRFIRKRKRGRAKIRRLGKKYYYIEPEEVKAPKPPVRGTVELRGYVNYTSDNPSRDIEIDCVIIVPNEQQTIITGSEQITEKVKHRLGAKLASMLKFGVSEANPSSANHFLFRRHGDEWIEF